jgi:membrane-associated phospholipid phosphatase
MIARMQAVRDPDPPLGWRDAAALFTRTQPVTWPMVAMFSIVPLYLFIGGTFRATPTVHVPAIALDQMLPLVPAWSIVYGSLLLVPLLPALVIHQPELIRRAFLAFLGIWLAAYAVFFFYPTVTSRPEVVAGDGFFAAALRLIYDSDTAFNCFPSLHVAQCFLAASACYVVHRGVGLAAAAWALLVALSTLFTKQHYVLDAIGGVVLAAAGYWLGLRSFPREAIPDRERRLAPGLALFAFAIYALVVAGFWIAYLVSTW